MTAESKENLAQTPAPQGPPKLPVVHQRLKTHKSLHANQLQRQHQCACPYAGKTRGDKKSSLGRKAHHIGTTHWETMASAICRMLHPLRVSLWLHPIQPGSVEQGPALSARELLQGSSAVPVTTEGSLVGGLGCFLLFC